MHTNTNNVNR